MIKTMNKDACKRCYQYHEASWGEWEDVSWDEGIVACPKDAARFIKDGIPIPTKHPMSKLLSSIFCNDINIDDGPPPWCNFSNEHEKNIDEN